MACNCKSRIARTDAPPTHSWLPARVQLSAVLLLLCLSALVAGMAHASQSQIGQTWPIAEPDALTEIEAKAASLPPDLSKAFGPPQRWSAMRAAPLGVAQTDRIRSVIPFYTLEFDIALPDGKIAYPKGFTFNPLSFVTLPQRLVVVHPRDIGWALKTARPSDFILLSALGAENGDAIALGEKAGRAIFILEERVKARLGLTVAPVIVAQSGMRLILTEVGPQGRGSTKGPAR